MRFQGCAGAAVGLAASAAVFFLGKAEGERSMQGIYEHIRCGWSNEARFRAYEADLAKRTLENERHIARTANANMANRLRSMGRLCAMTAERLADAVGLRGDEQASELIRIAGVLDTLAAVPD